MTPILPLWAVITIAAIWAAGVITLLAMAIGKAIKYLTGPACINDDCMLDDSNYGPVPKEDFVL